MKYITIYQTLEDRQNDDAVKRHGPYFCSIYKTDGKLKTGSTEPWLGEGYYFWDSRLDDAKWWGETIYTNYGKGYIICSTSFDLHSPLLFDMVGDLSAFDDFIECAKYIKQKQQLSKISFSYVLAYLKELPDFKYKAIRVWPSPKTLQSTLIKFPKNDISLKQLGKVQICFFDKTLLTQPFDIIYKHQIENDFTSDFAI